ncbi:nuclear transport factor 2 family protein [Geobacter sp.]|uniref:nuclear transport factor 2 family protein n=1 Tax=Geobacter sp. TaxID=46610 RepID=UPI001ACA757B|nr:nuclear transport factor 2 family protein [Geobacter sp.]CAG0943292.1 limonene-1,2-epoxide hydrolase [Anaerolineae bacterium]
MTNNKRTIQKYMEGFRETDREKIQSCLTDDVEWEIPGLFHSRGRAAFNNHIVDPGFAGNPIISVTRMTEENDVVIAEGTVLATREDGTSLPLAFCDVFELENGKIRRLTSYLMETGKPASCSGV